MVNYIDWLLNIKITLYPQDKFHLVMMCYPFYTLLDSIWENVVKNSVSTCGGAHKRFPILCELWTLCPLLPWGGCSQSQVVASLHALINSQLRHEAGRSPELSFWAAPSSLVLCLQTRVVSASWTFTLSPQLRGIGSTWDPFRHSSLKILSRQETGAIKGPFLRGDSSLRGQCSVLPAVQCLKSIVSCILSSVSAGRVNLVPATPSWMEVKFQSFYVRNFVSF